jgi:type II restriction/modification system DNA methylase subunit YeeA
VYWFQKASELLLSSKIAGFGLVGTKSIAKGASRKPLTAICADSAFEIGEAWTNEPWTVEGADVRVAIVCARQRSARPRRLNDKVVNGIGPDLTPTQAFGSITDAVRLPENAGVAFQGVKLTGSFDVDGATARAILLAGGNPNGRPNSDVLKRLWDIDDVVGRPSDRWVIDFGTNMERVKAAQYEKAFEHIAAHVPAQRAKVREKRTQDRFWIFQRSRPELRKAIATLSRYIVTPESSEHRLFCWAHTSVLPVGSLFAIARDDDTSFGILHSRIHDVWASAQGNRLGVGNQRRYNITVTFETFPFPAGMTPNLAASTYEGDPRAARIAAAARNLVQQRETWLNPPEYVERVPEVVSGYPDRLVPRPSEAAEVARRGLTPLYNSAPAWLQDAHRALDEAVAAAYGWEWPLAEDEILARLFKLNQGRKLV